jgi:hypothetical protein
MRGVSGWTLTRTPHPPRLLRATTTARAAALGLYEGFGEVVASGSSSQPTSGVYLRADPNDMRVFSNS